jgi:hypothetical protein
MPRDRVFVEMSDVPGHLSRLKAVTPAFFFLTFGNAS